ncbi:MAG TPA: signal peptidase II [Pseudolysinimonas sp.]|nr:signal peptidase II [Pseudolysinimonas sp.]
MPRAADTDATEATTRRGRIRVGALLLLAGVAVGVYGLDLLSKYLITQNLELGETVPVLGELVQLHYVTNSGAAFSLASGFTWVLSIIAAGVIVFIVVFAPRIRSLGWATMFGLVLGGALGNVTDRVFRGESIGTGHVIDFLQLYAFPAIFNVADIGVVSAMGLFVLLSLRGVGLDGTRTATVKTTPKPVAESDEQA